MFSKNDYRGFTFEERANYCLLQFNRPEKRNPLSVEVLEDINSALDHLSDNKTPKTLVFCGSDGVFASGANLREVASLTVEEALAFGLRGQRLMRRISGLPFDTIAAIEGFCMGGALDLAVSCKRRIADPGTVFAHPGVSLGIITGWGGTQMLPALVGRKRANYLFLSGKKIDASSAYRMGLIDRVVSSPLEFALEELVSRK
ncbi:MAG: enoyl-CoA hydratase/isomerase family protein [Pyrinomonadaceae bacterium]